MFDCNWTTNKGETEMGGGGGAAYMVPKDPSLNRVKGQSIQLPNLVEKQKVEVSFL